MGWVLQSQDLNLPSWVQDNLDLKCRCGAEKENFYNVRGECTGRRCSNLACPTHMAEKIVYMCDILLVKGIGSATALKLADSYKLKTHLAAIPYILKDRPVVTLYDLMRMCCIRGVATKWAEATKNYNSVDEMVNSYKGQLVPIIQENLDLIKYGESLVNIHQQADCENEPLITGNVMITGNIKGLSNRDSLIYALNKQSRGLIQLNVCGKRKTGVMCLIKEEDASVSGKVDAAIASNIPIMTPEQFIKYITKLLKQRLEEREK